MTKRITKDPQDIVKMNTIASCLYQIQDVRYRNDLSDEETDHILKNVYNDLGKIYDSLKWVEL